MLRLVIIMLGLYYVCLYLNNEAKRKFLDPNLLFWPLFEEKLDRKDDIFIC